MHCIDRPELEAIWALITGEPEEGEDEVDLLKMNPLEDLSINDDDVSSKARTMTASIREFRVLWYVISMCLSLMTVMIPIRC